MSFTGAEHPLTKEVYKELSKLEVILQYSQHHHTFQALRNNNENYSSLSWHEADLLQFKHRKDRQKAKKRTKKLTNLVRTMIAFGKVKQSVKKDHDKEVVEMEEKLSQKFNVDEDEMSEESLESQDDVKSQETPPETPLLPSSERCGISPPASVRSDISVRSKPVTFVEIKKVDSLENKGEYLDNFASNNNPPSTVQRILRPQSAPFKTFQKYEAKGFEINALRTETPRKRQVSSAPPKGKAPVTSEPKVSYHHDRVGQQPPRSGTLVYNGPNTTTHSLLSPDVPRQITMRLHHKSAWYHVPGRYSTTQTPYPPKRSQTRVDTAHKKLVKNIRLRSSPMYNVHM